MMKIAVLGYYGFGNWGDEVILDNLRRFLAPHTVVPIPLGLPDSVDTVRRLNAFDFVILGGGGLYRKEPPSPFATFDRWGNDLTVPIGVLGLGISRLAPRFAAATHNLIERSLFFQVRDEESRRLLDHPKVELAPDLTFYRPLGPAPERAGEGQIVCGINLRPAQAGISRWIEAVQGLDCRKLAIPFSSHPTLGDREALLSLDPQCLSHFSLDTFASTDILIGTAFHSLLFAVQMGIPVIAINYDPKVERFMRELELTDYMLSWDEPHRLRASYERAVACRDTIRQRMLGYRAEAQRAVQQALQEPRRIIDGRKRKVAPLAVPRPLPKVSLIVHGREVTAEAAKRTLASCLDQTYHNVEVVLTAVPAQKAWLASLLPDVAGAGRVRRQTLPEGAADWGTAGLQVATGEYVAWLQLGDWYAADAVAMLATALQQNKAADLAHASYFLTREGVIERKISLDTPHKPGKATHLGACLLVRRRAAAGVWQQTSQNGVSGGPGRAVYLQNALFYKPATDNESNLFRALVAFGRGDYLNGERLLARVASAGWERPPAQLNDLVALIAATARNAPAGAGAEAFVELLFSRIPPAPGLDSLKRRALAQVAMRRFFERYRESTRPETFRTLLSAVRKDPSWLGNRGVWMIMLRLCLGQVS
jgi:hypothetical protein